MVTALSFYWETGRYRVTAWLQVTRREQIGRERKRAKERDKEIKREREREREGREREREFVFVEERVFYEILYWHFHLYYKTISYRMSGIVDSLKVRDLSNMLVPDHFVECA